MKTDEWWASQRLNYNLWLVFSGLSAFFCYAVLVWSFPEALPEAEITLFTIIFQAFGYLGAMFIANICFFLGPITENVINPINVNRFRKNTYSLGKWFSVTLPFLVPLMVVIAIVNNNP